MAGLWCVNIGYGRTELAAVAAKQMQALSYYPHTGINQPAASLAEQINGLLGGDNHIYFVNCQNKRSRLQDRPPVYEARIPR